MNVYRASFDTLDGERNYTQYECVIAETTEEAEEHFGRVLMDWHADEGELLEGVMYSYNHETATKITRIEQRKGFMVVTISGDWRYVGLDILEKGVRA